MNILYLTDYPSKYKDKVFYKLMLEINKHNNILGYVSDKPIKSKKDIVAKRAEILDIISKENIDLVIGLGDTSIKCLLGKKSRAISKLRHRKLKANNVQFYFTYGLGSIGKSPYFYKYILNDIKWALNKAKEQEASYAYAYRYINSDIGDVSRFISGEKHSFDVETTGLNPYKDKIVRASYSDNPYMAVGSPAAARLDTSKIIEGKNLPFDMKFYRKSTGDTRRFKLFDTRVSSSLLDENSPDNSLKAFSGEHTELGHYEDIPHKEGDALTLYSLRDADVTHREAEYHRGLLKKQGLTNLFEFLMDIENILIDMEYRGVLIDEKKYKANKQRFQTELLKAQSNLLAINPNSPKQKIQMIYQTLGMPVMMKTKTGQPSTDARAIKTLLRGDIPEKSRTFLQNLLDFMKYDKLLSTYIDGLNIQDDGRVHTTYHLAKGDTKGTVTGRLSSTNPNLQNPPRREGIRPMFIPDKYNRWFEADYSQLELRVVAFLAQETALIDYFNKGYDVHTAVLSDFVGKPYGDVVQILLDLNHPEHVFLKEMRVGVKAVNFGILYGMGKNKLQWTLEGLGIFWQLVDCQAFIDKWLGKYSKIKIYLEKIKYDAEHNHKIVTPFGRIKHMPDFGLCDGNFLRFRLLRQACNFPVQSVASDITLCGLEAIDKKEGIEPLLTVHDSICGQFDNRIIKDWDAQIMIVTALEYNTKQILYDRFGIDFNVPLISNVKITNCWS